MVTVCMRVRASTNSGIDELDRCRLGLLLSSMIEFRELGGTDSCDVQHRGIGCILKICSFHKTKEKNN